MASPMAEGRVDPYKKAHYSLHISDLITQKEGNAAGSNYSGIKYNHKPAQTTSSRSTALKPTTAPHYNLTLTDTNGPGKGDVFRFTGQKTAPKKTYVLIFDPASQKATLEPLDSTYTFNLASRNGVEVPSTKYPHIYPRKAREPQDTDATLDEDLFDEGADDDGEADPENPYDFRHFLGAVGGAGKEKRSDESEYASNSPDYRTGTGSAMNTPLVGARKLGASTTSTPASKLKAKPKAATATVAKGRKRKSPEPETAKKPAPAKKQAPPAVRIDRRASTHPKPEAPSTTAPKGKKAAPAASAAASKIKSAEIVHSSDDSDLDAASTTSSPPPAIQRSPSPAPHSYPSDEEDGEVSEEDNGGGLEIEVPDARPPKRALASLGLGQSLGLGSLSHLKSPGPSRGPISLISAANSVDGSPDLRASNTQEEYDFGDIGGYDEDEDGDGEVDDEEEEERRERDGDVEPMDIGPPAQTRKMSIGGMAQDEEEDDPLYKEMMEGLAGDSSEESEEE